MNIIEAAMDALKLIQQGREALAGVTSAINDGTAAISTQDKAELDAMLQREQGETQAAYNMLDDAIGQAQE